MSINQKDMPGLARAIFLNGFSLTKDFPDRTIFEIAFRRYAELCNVGVLALILRKRWLDNKMCVT